jgi:hypothetical protein
MKFLRLGLFSLSKFFKGSNKTAAIRLRTHKTHKNLTFSKSRLSKLGPAGNQRLVADFSAKATDEPYPPRALRPRRV